MARKFFVPALAVLAIAFAAFALPQQHPAVDMPSRWFVLLDVGAKFDANKLLREQMGFMDHVLAIRKMTEDGALLLGGPLLETFESHKPTGEIMVVQAESEEAARKLVATDPFVSGEIMKITSVRAFFAGAGVWLPGAKPIDRPSDKPTDKADGGH